MKKITAITVLSILALTLAACGAVAGISHSSPSAGSSSSSQAGGTPAANNPPTGLQLAAGTLKLDGTSNAVTQQEAGKLLPLWQALQQTETQIFAATSIPNGTATPGPRIDPAMMQQMATEVSAIEAAMTPAQIQAISAMNLSRQDISAVFQQDGIQMGFGQGGGFGGGGGFQGNGGTITPPNGTPRAPGTPGAFQRNGARGGFASFIPPTVVDGMVQWLQTKSGS